LRRAISVGTERVEKSLAATFRIRKGRPGPIIGGIRTPIGFKRKPGLIFIEKPRKRLSEVTEIKGIQLARLRRRK